MRLPDNFNNLDPRVQEILKSHLKEDPTPIEGETGHLLHNEDTPPLPERNHAVEPTKKNPPPKKFTTWLDRSLPPGDRD